MSSYEFLYRAFVQRSCEDCEVPDRIFAQTWFSSSILVERSFDLKDPNPVRS
jgi:hypothetical protein